MDFLSRVLPELRPVLSLFPSLELSEDTIASARQALFPPAPPSDEIRTSARVIGGADGQDMLVKVYEPADRSQELLPALLWIHGGGYVLGHPDQDDGLCQTFSQTARCVVASVDYRLAPEHRYPAAIEDCYAALKWMAASSEELRIDPSRLAIGGASAGGGLTAALALLARDRGGPAISFQMPLYPMIDDRNATPSSHEITDDKAVWNRDRNLIGWRMYLGEHAGGEVPPYAAPARAARLEGLPPTYTCVGQLDPFRDETLDYVSRLAQAGVDVEFELYPGCFHGFESIVPQAEVSRRAKQGYVDALARALNRATSVAGERQ